MSLDLDKMEYRAQQKANFATLELTKSIDAVIDRFPVLVEGKDKAGAFYRKSFGALFAYVSYRIPEITDDLFKIDDAMKAGFGWEHGPFQIWDAIGLDKGLELIADSDLKAAPWVAEMKAAGITSFYDVKDGATYFYDIPGKAYKKVPGQDGFIILDNIRKSKEVFKNSGVVVEDLGDGILNVEFQLQNEYYRGGCTRRPEQGYRPGRKRISGYGRRKSGS